MLTFVLGTRPEIIKCAPVIHEARRRGVPFAIVHSGQHYTPSLDELFFQELDLPAPVANLQVGSLEPALQIATIIQRLVPVFREIKPTIVLVQGDTNTVLACALAAHKMDIPVAHLEAGMRCDDWTMPEEGNRVLTSMVADFHFCPTALQRARLNQEGITEGVHVVGNTIVDAALYFADVARSSSSIIKTAELNGAPFAMLTMHRPSNVDDPKRLVDLMACLNTAATASGLRIVFPVHPRTEDRLRKAGLWDRYANDTAFVMLAPVGYLDLLRLQNEAAIVLTDSGGIQEEACVLKVPCITLRPNTERPETVAAGGNILFDGTDSVRLAELIRTMREKELNWTCPFGDGKTAERVLDILSL